MRTMLRLGTILICVLGAARTTLGAEESDRSPNIEVKAEHLLREMSKYLASETAFTFRADVTYDSEFATGQKIQYGGVANIFVSRPDRLRAEYRGDERQNSVVFDGSQITIFDLEQNLYAQTTVPAGIDAAVDYVFDKYGFSVPIADFVYADVYQVLTEFVDTGSWLGRHAVDGTPCHHLAFTQESIDWQIWIEDGPRPLPRKLVITYKDEPSSLQYTARLSGWDFAPGLSDSWFIFEPPLGSNPMEFLPNPEVETHESESDK